MYKTAEELAKLGLYHEPEASEGETGINFFNLETKELVGNISFEELKDKKPQDIVEFAKKYAINK